MRRFVFLLLRLRKQWKELWRVIDFVVLESFQNKLAQHQNYINNVSENHERTRQTLIANRERKRCTTMMLKGSKLRSQVIPRSRCKALQKGGSDSVWTCMKNVKEHWARPGQSRGGQTHQATSFELSTQPTNQPRTQPPLGTKSTIISNRTFT